MPEESQIRQLIQGLDDLPPKEGANSPFWKTLESEDFKLGVNLLLLNELNTLNIDALTPIQALAKLSQLKAYSNMLLLPAFLKNHVEEASKPKEHDPLED